MKNKKLDGRLDIMNFTKEELKNESPGKIVLDAGAGDPNFQVRVPGHTYYTVDLGVGDEGWDYSGIDIIGNLENIPVADDSVDIVIMTQVLEHMSEPFQVVSEVARVLKKGGKSIITLPQEFFMHQEPYDFFRYTKHGIEYLVDKAGLEVEFIEPIGGYFRHLAYELSRLEFFLIPRIDNKILKIIRWPFKLFVLLILEVMFPFILEKLDKLDRNPKTTLGYKLIARKPLRQRKT